jgi:hypothetical protein
MQAPRQRRKVGASGEVQASVGLFMAGIAAIALALWMMLPVVVNLPDSWFGMLVIAALLVGGGALVYRGAKAFRKVNRLRRHS